MDTSKWNWFRYDEIFDIKKGKRLTKENMTEGNIRYIGAIDSNNGLLNISIKNNLNNKVLFIKIDLIEGNSCDVGDISININNIVLANLE